MARGWHPTTRKGFNQMSDTHTPEDTKVDVDMLSTEDYIAHMGGEFKDGSKVDVPVFDSAVAQISAQLPILFKAENESTEAKKVIAMAITALRGSILYKGKPDTFGSSDAYRILFKERITLRLKKDNPTLDSDWIKKRLDQVRINYLGWTATRSKGMTMDAIVQDAARTGEIPNAKVMGDGRVVISPTRKLKDGTVVPVTDKVKAEDGTTTEVPRVLTYTPGQTVDVPDVVSKAVRKVIEERAPSKKNEDGTVVKTVTVPEWFGGPAKPKPGTGGGKPKGPEDFAKQYREGLDAIASSVNHLTAEAAIQWFHAAATVLVDAINGTKQLPNPADRASELRNITALLSAEAAVLEGKKPVDVLDGLRYVPEDAPKDTPKNAPSEDVPTEDDVVAADAAAKNEA